MIIMRKIEVALSFIVLLLVLGVFASANKDQKENYELKMVHVVFRHGARTPATKPYPNDPHINFTYEPYGYGELTNVGKQQMFELGEFLRNRYDDFLGKQVKLEEIHAQSSGYSRTKASLQLVLASLFPPKGTDLEWNPDLNWQPIPYDYEEIAKDMLLMVNVPCPRYEKEFKRIAEMETQKVLVDHPNMFEELSSYTGYKKFGIMEFMAIYDNLKSEEEFGLKLPEWSKQFYPHKMKILYKKFFFWQGFNPLLKRLKGGVLLKKIINDWQDKLEGKSRNKITLFSGHDITVINLLSAINIVEQQGPSYVLTTILEFLQDKFTKEHGVRVLLKNSTLVDPLPLRINGCEEFCTLKKLKTLVEDNIPMDWTKECQN